MQIKWSIYMFENKDKKMWSNRSHIASPKREATIHVSCDHQIALYFTMYLKNNSISKGPYSLYCHLPHTTSTVT